MLHSTAMFVLLLPEVAAPTAAAPALVGMPLMLVFGALSPGTGHAIRGRGWRRVSRWCVQTLSSAAAGTRSSASAAPDCLQSCVPFGVLMLAPRGVAANLKMRPPLLLKSGAPEHVPVPTPAR